MRIAGSAPTPTTRLLLALPPEPPPPLPWPPAVGVGVDGDAVGDDVVDGVVVGAGATGGASLAEATLLGIAGCGGGGEDYSIAGARLRGRAVLEFMRGKTVS